MTLVLPCCYIVKLTAKLQNIRISPLFDELLSLEKAQIACWLWMLKLHEAYVDLHGNKGQGKA